MIPPGIETRHSVRNSRLLPLAPCLSVCRSSFCALCTGRLSRVFRVAQFSPTIIFLNTFFSRCREAPLRSKSQRFFLHVIHQRNDHRGLQFLRNSSPAPCDVFRQFLHFTEIRSCKCVFFLHLLSSEAIALTKPILSPRGESLRKI